MAKGQSSTEPSLVRVVVRGPLARLTLNAPDKGNALDLALARALEQAVLHVASLPDVAVLRLDAEGRAFCVGGDLREFAGVLEPRTHVARVAASAHAALTALREMAAVVVTVVQGVAAGGGLGLALAGDVILAARSARFRSAYTAAGLSPDCGATARLVAAVGAVRTMDLVLTNRTLAADEALTWGLVSRVVDDEELETVAAEVVERLASGAREALIASKRLVHDAPSRTFVQQLDAEARSIAALSATPDGREGINAFLAKRPPRFASVARDVDRQGRPAPDRHR